MNVAMTIIDLETALAKQQNDAPMQSQTRDRSDEPHKCTAQGQKPPIIEMFGKVHHCQLPLRLPAHQEQSQLVLAQRHGGKMIPCGPHFGTPTSQQFIGIRTFLTLTSSTTNCSKTRCFEAVTNLHIALDRYQRQVDKLQGMKWRYNTSRKIM